MTLFSDHAFPRHAHDELGIGYVLSGAQRSWSVLGQVDAQAGDVIMVNPGEMHDGHPLGGPRRWRIIYFEPSLIEGLLAQEATVKDWTVKPVARDRMLAADVARLFARMDEESLLVCLMRILDLHEVRGKRPAPASPSVARAVRRLDDAPQASHPLAELARHCDVTRFQLLRGFAREVGTTPHAYLLQRRVRLARRLLAAGKAPADAAALSGFSDQSHLTRVFARHYGVTPGRYRAHTGRRVDDSG